MATLIKGVQNIFSAAATITSSRCSAPRAMPDLDWLSSTLKQRYPVSLKGARFSDTDADQKDLLKFRGLLKKYHGFDPINNPSRLYTASSQIDPLDVSLLDPIYAEVVLDADDINERRRALEFQGQIDMVAHCLASVLLERTEELKNQLSPVSELSGGPSAREGEEATTETH